MHKSPQKLKFSQRLLNILRQAWSVGDQPCRILLRQHSVDSVVNSPQPPSGGAFFPYPQGAPAPQAARAHSECSLLYNRCPRGRPLLFTSLALAASPLLLPFPSFLPCWAECSTKQKRRTSLGIRWWILKQESFNFPNIKDTSLIFRKTRLGVWDEFIVLVQGNVISGATCRLWLNSEDRLRGSVGGDLSV